jgi:glycosyltransferase involved in cell wall biosynthesis
MKIAMMGTRGIPANYGGFETCVEAISTRLVQRGHQVTVYNRPHHVKWRQPTYQGVRLVRVPTIPKKIHDTPVHTALAALHASAERADIVLIFVAANSPITLLPRLAGRKTVLHVDGLDWKREKWPPLAKRYIRGAEWLGTHLPHAIITDSRVVQHYYRDTFHAHAEYIAYGADVEPAGAGQVLAQFGLRPREYILFVGRLVPENRETMGAAGFGYNGLEPVASLRTLLQGLVDDPARVAAAIVRATEHAHRTFSWEQVTDAYEALFLRMLNQAVPAPRAMRVMSDE